MMDLVRQRTIVQPGGLVEVRLEHLPPGTPVDVLVQPVVEEAQGNGLRGLRGKAKGVYATPEDAARRVRSLRDEWES